MSQTLVNPILFNAYLGSEGVSRQSNRLPRTKKMTTDRKDGQSENYGFTLVINTPLPVYDSGSKPLEVVGELTVNIKDMEIKDEKIKKDIVGIIGQSSMIDMEKSFDWLKEAPDSEDYSLRLWCIKQSHPRHKDVYGWIKQENRQ